MTTLAEVEVLIKANLGPLEKGALAAEKRAVALERKLDKALSTAPKNAQSEFKKLNTTLKATSAIVGTLAGSIAAGLFARSVREFATFEQGLKNVASVSGATKMELAALGDAALQAAATTRFNPSQTTQALYSLASAGQAAQQQIDSLPNVLNFAEAAQADLGRSTEIITSTLNVFGIQAAESARVADVFTASIGASSLNASRIQVALRNAGPTAAALGQSFEATTASLAILTSSFGNGERAGTGLRAILVEMGDKAKDLGINVKNAQGEFLPLIDVIRQIEKRGITSTQIIENFGAEAGPSLAALLKQGSSALEEMEMNIQSTGQAAEVAASQLDTLSGDFDGLQSAISAAMVQIGESQAGTLREVTQTVTNLIRLWSGYANTLGDAEEKTRSLSTTLAAISGILATRVVAGVLTTVSAMGALQAATVLATGALRVLGLTNPLGLLITAIGAATTAFSLFKDDINPVSGELATLGDFGVVAWQKIKGGAEEASQAFGDAMSQISTFISEALGGAEVSFAGLGEFVKTIINTLIGRFAFLYETIIDVYTKLPQGIADAVLSAMNVMISGVERALNFVIEKVNAVLNSINNLGGNVGLSVGQISSVELTRITNDFAGAGEAAGEAFVQNAEALTKDFIGNAFSSLSAEANALARLRIDRDDPRNGVFSPDRPTSSTNPITPIAGKAPTLPGDASKSKKGRVKQTPQEVFSQSIEQIEKRTAALLAEFEAQSQLNPLIEDYGFTVEKARIAHELLTAAEEAGVEVTPELKQQIDELAEAYANASVETEILTEKQDEVRQKAEDMASANREFVGGIVSDLRNGVSAADALSNALDRIIDRLSDQLLDELFPTNGSGGGGFGSVLGSLFGGFGGGGGGFSSTAALTQGTGGLFANGGAFSNGSVIPFANGGVVSSATNFPMSGGRTGLMGEAGPEAIMPLTRVRGGKLGVAAANQQPMNVHVTVGVSADSNGNIRPFVESVSQDQAANVVAQAAPQILSTSEATAGRNLSNGTYDGSMQSRFNVKPSVRSTG